MILAGGKGERLYPLTRDRTKPAVPFGAIYRIIDFTLSNCVNSNIRRIYILTQYKSTSLNRHVELGWNIFSSQLGEFVRLIPAQQQLDESWYQGTADAIFQNFHTLQQDRPEVVLILSGDHVYKMDYRQMVDYHLERRADLTVAVLQVDRSLSRDLGVVEADTEYRIIGFQEKPAVPKAMPGDGESILASMGIYVFNTEILVKRLIEDFRDERSSHDFGKDVIPAMVGRDRVFAFPFVDPATGRPAYWRDVGTLDAYWEANMDLVSAIPQFNLYDTEWPIYTFQGPYPPAKTVGAQEDGTGAAINSLLSGGCIISGGKVVNSLLSPLVRVENHAEVEETILMEGVRVEKGARVRRAIVDKGINIPRDVQVGYDLKEDRKRYTVTDSGIVVIPKLMQVD
ncbi:MAG: glucose-1-phosphate adenylyltransferase [Deltaproteobacteria bacterium]|nr:glucose-1-phosphate adenylyltransferase [Deltaproteobacteria bacterium]MBW2120763.1 glucose-1-phosphate adenylyltransferase [Deltaproteobacteria bacterium]